VKFSAFTWKECGPCPVFVCYTLALPYNWGKKQGKHLGQGIRKVPAGRDSMYRNGRLLRVARTSCWYRSPCFRGPRSVLGQRRSAKLRNPTSANYESNLSVLEIWCGRLSWMQVRTCNFYGWPFLRALGSFVGNTLLDTTSRAQVIIILVTVTRQIAPTGQEKC